MAPNYWDRATIAARVSRRRLLGGAAATLGSAALLAACGSDGKSSSGLSPSASTSPSSSSSRSTAAGAQPKKGGRYTEHATPAQNLNPITQATEAGLMSGAHIYDRPLTPRLGDKAYSLEAMESIETPDPLRVVLKLKPGMTYHNIAPVSGRPVKSSDIAATQKYIISAPAFEKTFQVDFIDSIETPDDRTVTFKLKKSSAYLFGSSYLGNAGSQVIVPEEILTGLDNGPQIGSGPYQAGDVFVGSRFTYKRFNQFRDASKGIPYIDEREMLVLTDPVAIEAGFRGGQIQFFRTPPPAALKSIKADMATKARVETRDGLTPFGLFMNTKKDLPWKADVRVREAIYRTIDRKQLLSLYAGDDGRVPTGPLPVGLAAWQLDAKDTDQYFARDLQKAKQLLAAANFDTTKAYESLSTGVASQAAEVIAQQLIQAGIKINISNVQFPEFISRISKADYDLIVNSALGDDSPSKVLRYNHSDQKNQFGNFGLHDPEIDALIEKSEEATNSAENVKLVKQVEMLCLQHYSSAIQLITQNYSDIHYTSLQNWETNPIVGVAMYRVNMWYDA